MGTTSIPAIGSLRSEAREEALHGMNLEPPRVAFYQAPPGRSTRAACDQVN